MSTIFYKNRLYLNCERPVFHEPVRDFFTVMTDEEMQDYHYNKGKWEQYLSTLTSHEFNYGGFVDGQEVTDNDIIIEQWCKSGGENELVQTLSSIASFVDLTKFKCCHFKSLPRPSTPSPEAKGTAMQMLIAHCYRFGINLSINDIISKATELLEVERSNIIDARLSVTGLNHASPTDDTSLEEAEQYYNSTFVK